jgi:polyphosphate kinase 2 (PPK2 family)
VQGFLQLAPLFEKLMVGGNNIILLKYWLEVDMDEQTRRLEARITDPRKQWKLSPMDLKSYSRWYDYSRARDDMFRATDTDWAPWFVARSDDKKRVRLNIIKHILEQHSLRGRQAAEDRPAEAAESPATTRNPDW